MSRPVFFLWVSCLRTTKIATTLRYADVLFHLNGVHVLLVFLDLFGQMYGENAVLHVGRNLLAVYIVRQSIGLLVVAVGELAAQIVAVLVLALVLHLVLDGYREVALIVDTQAYPLLLQSGYGHLHGVGLSHLLDVDCGCRGVEPHHKVGVEEIVVKPIGQPIRTIVSTC